MSGCRCRRRRPLQATCSSGLMTTTMSRQFLNLVVKNVIRGRRPAYTLHRIDPSAFFFHPPADHQPTMEVEEFELPPATMTFYGPVSDPNLDFIPLGGGGNRGILALDGMGRAALYDAATPAISTMPSLHAPKVSPISLPVGDNVYVMDSNPGRRHCFEALIHGRGSRGRSDIDWYWHSLPMPPHVRPLNYAPYDSDVDDGDAYYMLENFDVPLDGPETADLKVVTSESGVDYAAAVRPLIDGHTVVGDSKILISTIGAGTYCFDTVSGSWREEAMGWSLPFTGRAEYVPERNLWFGFSSKDHRLCAVDLAGAAPPVVRGTWEDVPQLQDWTPMMSYILPLGSGKLFIAKFFDSAEKIRTKYGDCFLGKWESFAVFAGVELVAEEPSSGGGGLRMVKHRSKHYTHQNSLPDWLI